MQIAANPSILGCGPRETTASELDNIEELDRLYRSRLLRYVAFATGDQDLADTIVQDCLLNAYNARASFRGDCAVSTWLTHIATNLIRDHQRTRKFQFWRSIQKTAPDLTQVRSTIPCAQGSP